MRSNRYAGAIAADDVSCFLDSSQACFPSPVRQPVALQLFQDAQQAASGFAQLGCQKRRHPPLDIPNQKTTHLRCLSAYLLQDESRRETIFSQLMDRKFKDEESNKQMAMLDE